MQEKNITLSRFVSGSYVNQGYYKAFIPNEINQQWEIDNMEVLNLLSQADRHLGRLDMYSEYVNIDLYIQMHIAKEATQSTKIEGTKTNIEDAFLKKSDVVVEKRNDWEEVQNYIMAINEAVKKLDKLPFSSRLIKETHKILLSGVRGENRLPGEYRTSQNWIGGNTLSDAIFVPPPWQEIDRLMSDVEKFANSEVNILPELLKIAIIHYQFETIHPFLDGNGRIGRLIITLYLVSKKILKRPILYLSDYFEKNKLQYYDNLMLVRTNNDIIQWLKFFLNGVIVTAENGIKTFDDILQIQKSLDDILKPLNNRSTDARSIINYLFSYPIINITQATKIIRKSFSTTSKLIADMEKIGILKEITGAGRGKLYVFKEYINLFN